MGHMAPVYGYDTPALAMTAFSLARSKWLARALCVHFDYLCVLFSVCKSQATGA